MSQRKTEGSSFARDLGGMAVAGATAGAGGTTVTVCTPDDMSFYCQTTRAFKYLQMMVTVMVLLYVVYVLFKEYGPKFKRK